jgi:hypothetical protein
MRKAVRHSWPPGHIHIHSAGRRTHARSTLARWLFSRTSPTLRIHHATNIRVFRQNFWSCLVGELRVAASAHAFVSIYVWLIPGLDRLLRSVIGNILRDRCPPTFPHNAGPPIFVLRPEFPAGPGPHPRAQALPHEERAHWPRPLVRRRRSLYGYLHFPPREPGLTGRVRLVDVEGCWSGGLRGCQGS